MDNNKADESYANQYERNASQFDDQNYLREMQQFGKSDKANMTSIVEIDTKSLLAITTTYPHVASSLICGWSRVE